MNERGIMMEDRMSAASLSAHPHAERPDKLEIAVGVLAMVLVGFGVGSQLGRLELRPVDFGLLLTAWSGVAGLAGFGAAWLVRRRRLALFGVRSTSARWIVTGIGGGVTAFAVKVLVILHFSSVTGLASNPQAVYAVGGSGGAVSLVLATLLLGVFTPLGEEFLFRGVVTNGLLRNGAVIGVIGGALIFALLHGINIVFPAAFIEGIFAGEAFRRSGSVWPAVAVHVVYNLPTVPLMVLASAA